jgi:hypothetical protein
VLVPTTEAADELGFQLVWLRGLKPTILYRPFVSPDIYGIQRERPRKFVGSDPLLCYGAIREYAARKVSFGAVEDPDVCKITQIWLSACIGVYLRLPL